MHTIDVKITISADHLLRERRLMLAEQARAARARRPPNDDATPVTEPARSPRRRPRSRWHEPWTGRRRLADLVERR